VKEIFEASKKICELHKFCASQNLRCFFSGWEKLTATNTKYAKWPFIISFIFSARNKNGSWQKPFAAVNVFNY